MSIKSIMVSNILALTTLAILLDEISFDEHAC